MHLLILPEITTDAQNERFYTMALNAKRMRRERNLSQLETALSIGQAWADFTQIWKITHTASTLIYLTFFKLSKLFNCDINEFFKEISERGGGEQEQI